MDFLQYMQDKWNLDLIIILIVLLSGFFQSRYLVKTWIKTSEKHDQAIKTLVVSFVVSLVWIYLSNLGKADALPFAKYFISYFAATSLYELLVNPFTKWIKKQTGEPA